MKFKLTIAILLVIFTSTFIEVKAQTEEKKTLSDSTCVLGVITEGCFVGNSISSYCFIGSDKWLTRGSVVFVSGTRKCTSSYPTEIKDLYEIVHNTKTYYIEKDKISIKNYTFEDINNLSAETATKFKDYTNIMSKLIYENDVKEALNSLNSHKAAGLSIYDWSYYDESEYTEGTSAKITVYNPTNKTIKYLWFSFVGFNAVGDKVIDRRSGTSAVLKKAIGPIAKGETGSYKFEYVWFTDIVETAKIASIKVQYMDGTLKIIQNPKSITLSTKHKNILDETIGSEEE